MKWNEVHQKFLMYLPDDTFIYDFEDCEPVQNFFNHHLSKNTHKLFVLEIIRCSNAPILYWMTWNEESEKWILTLDGDKVYDFWNCGNVKRLFKKLDKNIPQTYKININLFNGGK